MSAPRRIINAVGNQRGITMMELVVSLVVISLIMVAVTTVFSPMLLTFRRANNFAEANPMMDNVAMLILDDLIAATGIIPPTVEAGNPNNDILSIQKSTHQVQYWVGPFAYDSNFPLIGRRIPEDLAPGGVPPHWREIFAPEFYNGKLFTFSWHWYQDTGLVRLTIYLDSPDGWSRYRTYTVRPPGLAS